MVRTYRVLCPTCLPRELSWKILADTVGLTVAAGKSWEKPLRAVNSLLTPASQSQAVS